MTMFSAAANRRQFFYGGGGGGGGYGVSGSGVGSDLVLIGAPMAEEEDRSTTHSLNESTSKNCNRGGGAADDDDDAWLQLSIGGGAADRKSANLVELELMPTTTTTTTSNNNNNNNNDDNDRNCISHSPIRPPPPLPAAMNFGGGYAPTPATAAFFLQGGSSSNFPPNQEINWAFRPAMIPLSIASPSSLMASAAALPAPPYLHFPLAAPPGVDFRVIQPPRRPHSGIWFMLQASQNQDKEPFLPQISKSYLRIKDGKMTIRLVIKYLVNKLRLQNESEIEIRCKGQRLQPSLTLQHVRDNIWSSAPRDNFVILPPNSSTAHHIMVLHYSRTSSTT
ncbi:protein LAX PANICLE 2 [Andrographis paniculata]|uniref:protein LAX PANICLE 2 n=1 Tax=Andrographis paniculata TaxID=175694 RepID=UPI0021E847B9|nr:protein LAX PANICLE 2 [Andrographis paniculata]XP_051116438.1 protein LAX PANICLE 2 [Andrographis paniculata]XP_051116439.1 protein LAX PANICLE 2 [Andrographis paniculata]